MSAKVYRNGAWEEITKEYKEEYKENSRFDDTKNSFVELGSGFSINHIRYNLSNNGRMLAGVVEFETSSPLRVNSKYYLGYLFPQFGYHFPILNSIYSCEISLYGRTQTFFPAIIWSDMYNENRRKITITPLFAVAASSTDTATVKVDFVYNLSSKLSSDEIELLFNN